MKIFRGADAERQNPGGSEPAAPPTGLPLQHSIVFETKPS